MRRFLTLCRYSFNDNRVSHTDFRSFSNLTTTFHRDTPYLLVYRRVGAELADEAPTRPLQPIHRLIVTRDNDKFLKVTNPCFTPVIC